ncbi:hypothetical protein [uncultured Psychroserpens sp.]|uniref:hypothetical protein n=1 Tax=uncultured Psychroserpens sp. TaxID=255436 RepID=UPI002631FBCC|nr:hypothetical protein [uncultured Psychroserpens sp.]
MKNFKTILKTKSLAVFAMALMTIFAVSCKDEDKDKFDVFADGGFVRFAQPFPNVVNISSLAEVAGVEITTTLEAPDGNVVSYRMSVSAMVAGTSYGPVDFGDEVTSFPRTITITMADLSTALGIDIADIGFGDTFNFIGTAINDQGVVYSGERLDFDEETGTRSGGNNSDDLLDENGYRNAFEFGFAIPCPPINNPMAGDWTVNMTDLYGDGWDGAFLTVEVDGVSEDYDIPAGDSAVHVINVPVGTAVLRLTYTSGSWEEEHIYEVVNPAGDTFGPFGPEPEMCPSLGI